VAMLSRSHPGLVLLPEPQRRADTPGVRRVAPKRDNGSTAALQADHALADRINRDRGLTLRIKVDVFRCCRQIDSIRRATLASAGVAQR
jgi:hypothetical protein